MANTYDVFGQSNPGTTLTEIYSPSSGTAFTGYMHVANQSGGTARTFRVAVVAGGGTTYLAYDTPLAANDAIAPPMPLTLGGGDGVHGYASNTDVHFTVMGVEIT